jgi:hypothetical protein
MSSQIYVLEFELILVFVKVRSSFVISILLLKILAASCVSVIISEESRLICTSQGCIVTMCKLQGCLHTSHTTASVAPVRISPDTANAGPLPSNHSDFASDEEAAALTLV